MAKSKLDTLVFLQDSGQVKIMRKMHIPIDEVRDSNCFVLPCKMESSEVYYLHVTAWTEMKSKKRKVKLAIPHNVVVLTAGSQAEEGIGKIVGFAPPAVK